MKKPLLIFLSCVFLFITACSVKPAEPELNFSCGIKSVYNGAEISGTVVSDKRHMLTLTVRTKQTGGLTYSYKDGSFKLKAYNMVVDSEDNYLPASAFAQVIYNVFTRLYNEKYSLSGFDNSSAEYKGESESGGFLIKSNIKTGKITELSVKSLDLKVEFS